MSAGAACRPHDESDLPSSSLSLIYLSAGSLAHKKIIKTLRILILLVLPLFTLSLCPLHHHLLLKLV